MKNYVLPLFLAASISSAFATPPELTDQDLPKFPPVECDKAASTVQVKQGFHVELAACEPLVNSPIAVAFDENGRMFVVEMIDYSERRDEKPHGGRIRVLEDTDGDGKYDKATVYADDLPWPTGLICYDGGLFVIATPDLLYLKDTNGGGKADVRKVIFSGFGNTKDRLNVQALANGLNWGLDNQIHGLTAPNGGIVTNMAVPTEKPLDLNGRNFCFDPHTLKMTPEAGGGQYGMSFDSRGRKFTCSNSDHINYFMYDGRYAERNRLYAMPKVLASIAVDGGAAEVYRVSPEEPWRVIRTKWRVSGISPGMIEGGGRSAGYFTGATGMTVYRGNAWPEQFLDNAFTGDAGGNLMHRKVCSPDDVGLKAERPTDEQKMEFLASRDTWFRPVLFANAPDGTFYVIDMYRQTIEHPWSLPEQIKKHLDLNAGNDRGRIYRIAPDGFKEPPLPRLSKASTKELVATLDNANGWHRDTAARLLYQRQDKSAVSALNKLLEKGNRFGRLHALHALDGLGALTEKHILTAMNDQDWSVREHAIKLSEKFVKKGMPSKKLWAKLNDLATDPSVNVRYQLAFTLGEMKNPERIAALTAIVKSDLSSTYMQAAAFSSLAEGSGPMFAMAAADPQFRTSAAGQGFLQQLVELIGAKNSPEDVGQVLKFLATVDDPALSFSLVRTLGNGLHRAGSSLEKVAGADMKPFFSKAARVVRDDKVAEPVRLQAIQLLGLTSFGESGATLLDALNSNQAQSVQLAALTTLGRFNDAQVAIELTNRWDSFTPRIRSEALNLLLARPERAVVLLNAVQAGSINRNTLTTPELKFLRNHKDKAVRALTLKVLGPVTASKRQDVIDSFHSALDLKPDAKHGKEIYEKLCVSCHRLGGEGHQLGPDLVTVKNTGKEKMLVNILDPNREVAPQFQASEIELKDGDSLIGIIANDTGTSLTVRQAFGKEDVVLRSNIAHIKNQNQSLMPEGLETGMKPQDLADLLEYVSTADAK